ncbi:MAG: 2-dehydropantoate 2-reductase N-terminal domain-containing protein [Christensenellaceae bacterium]
MSAEKLKIAIYGAGAMGTVLGALLSDCALEAKVDLISRNRAHVEGLKKAARTSYARPRAVNLP